MSHSEAWETFEHSGFTCSLYPDYDAEPPNASMDLFGTFGHWHRNYVLGDVALRGGPPTEYSAAFERSQGTRFGLAYFVRYLELVERAVAVVPVGMLDHSGVTIYAGGGAHWCDSGGWDSGTVGLYWATLADCETFGVDVANAESVIRGEIETWAAYLEGNICGYVVEDSDGETVDSCSGFYPDVTPADPLGFEHVRAEARAAAEYEAERRATAAAVEKLERERAARQDIATV